MTFWTSGRNFHYSRINCLPGRNAFEVFNREVLTQVCSLSIYLKIEQPPSPTVKIILQFIQITIWIQPWISKHFLFSFFVACLFVLFFFFTCKPKWITELISDIIEWPHKQNRIIRDFRAAFWHQCSFFFPVH